MSTVTLSWVEIYAWEHLSGFDGITGESLNQCPKALVL